MQELDGQFALDKVHDGARATSLGEVSALRSRAPQELVQEEFSELVILSCWIGKMFLSLRVTRNGPF